MYMSFVAALAARSHHPTSTTSQTLESLKSFPATAEYRINVEKVTNYRLKVPCPPDTTSLPLTVQ